MSKALQAMTKRENALLESPTGTGKTLALLSSSIAWLRKRHAESASTTSFDSTPSSSSGTSSYRTPPAPPTSRTFADFIYQPPPSTPDAKRAYLTPMTHRVLLLNDTRSIIHHGRIRSYNKSLMNFAHVTARLTIRVSQ